MLPGNGACAGHAVSPAGAVMDVHIDGTLHDPIDIDAADSKYDLYPPKRKLLPFVYPSDHYYNRKMDAIAEENQSIYLDRIYLATRSVIRT